MRVCLFSAVFTGGVAALGFRGNPNEGVLGMQPEGPLKNGGGEEEESQIMCVDVINGIDDLRTKTFFQKFLQVLDPPERLDIEDSYKDDAPQHVEEHSTLPSKLSDPDKIVTNVMHVINGHLIDHSRQLDLADCIVDDDGNPLLFKVVERGFAGTLAQEGIWSFLPCDTLKDLATFTNKRGQNILHKAAQSHDAEVASRIVKKLQAQISTDELSAMLGHKDADGYTPIALAIEEGATDIQKIYDSHVTTLHISKH